MQTWYAIYEDVPQSEAEVESAERGSGILDRFDAAAKQGSCDGRKVRGMWIIDHNTEQADIIRRHGRVPGNIAQRHETWKRGQAEMRIWELSPIDTTAPNWHASTYSGKVVIRAADEKRARWIAALAFSIAVPDSASETPLFPPWRHSDLVSAGQMEDPQYPREGEEAILDPGEYDQEWRR